MLVDLICHPDTRARAIQAVTAQIARREGGLAIRYVARGDIGRLRIPEPVRYSSRCDELWKTTCFEAFARARERDGYQEFNFAPSTAWAAYRFESYRGGGADQPLPAPHFDVERSEGALEVIVVVDTGEVIGLPENEAWQINLAAVIEETDGTKSYWALAHPPGKPDFHHPDCFVLELPAPAQP